MNRCKFKLRSGVARPAAASRGTRGYDAIFVCKQKGVVKGIQENAVFSAYSDVFDGWIYSIYTSILEDDFWDDSI